MDSSTLTPRATAPAAPPDAPPRRAWLVVLAAVLLSTAWPIAWVATHGGHPSVLIATNHLDPAARIIEREIPDGTGFPHNGHDGEQYYVVARTPLDPAQAAPSLDSPAYRERRILFPLAAWAIAPAGGMRLVWAFLFLSLASVAVTAWCCTRLRGAPWWLPLAVAVLPGVGAALMLSLGDVFALALATAAFVAAGSRRWNLLVVLLVAAVLARETNLVMAAALALTPGMPRRTRVAVVAIPLAVLGAWMTWVQHELGGGSAKAAGQQFALPLVGWLNSTDRPPGLIVGLLSLVILGLALRRLLPRDLTVATLRGLPEPAVTAFIAATLGIAIVCADDVTTSWLNTTRVVLPAMPLALWVLFRSEPSEAAAAPATSAVLAGTAS